MTGTVPNPGDISEPTLVYDRIGTNKRQTWLMMLLFVVVAGGFATLIGLVVGLPIYAAPFIIAALVV